jgi:4-hydroxy-3-methylbut-2-enyl diphosphate reductase
VNTAGRVNIRTPDVMLQVQAQVETHYHSRLVDSLREQGGVLVAGKTTIRLAKQFGFCYGVERAIDLAYAAAKVFSGNRIFLLGEIIHNPDVNAQMQALGIRHLPARPSHSDFASLEPDDVIVVPAFGAESETVDKIRAQGCRIVDTTCGDVMSVWKRVRQNAREGVTSIIHGKSSHEETLATASRARGIDGTGRYLVVLNLDEAEAVAQFIEKGGDPIAFIGRFGPVASPDFDPTRDLVSIGLANQTTMLRSETEAIQARLRAAIATRDHGDTSRFRVFDTICGATQERQDSLFELLDKSLDLLVVVGGYNSSNTTHLVEIGIQRVPTWFIRNAACIVSKERILHYDIQKKLETSSTNWLPAREYLSIGITAGASCPNNLIEDTIRRVLELREESHTA